MTSTVGGRDRTGGQRSVETGHRPGLVCSIVPTSLARHLTRLKKKKKQQLCQHPEVTALTSRHHLQRRASCQATLQSGGPIKMPTAFFFVVVKRCEPAVGPPVEQVQVGLQGARQRCLNTATVINYSAERGEYSTCRGNTGQVLRMFVG